MAGHTTEDGAIERQPDTGVAKQALLSTDRAVLTAELVEMCKSDTPPDMTRFRALCVAGADINAIADENRNSVLIYAIYRGHLDATQTLLEFDADPYAKNTHGSDAFSYAANNSAGEHLKAAEKKIKARQRMKQAAGIWTLQAPDTVAEVRTYHDLDYKITQIFNFTAQERTVITEKISNGLTVGDAKRDALSDCGETLLRRAVEVLQENGGHIDPRDMPSCSLSKKRLQQLDS